jgi:hypothetical protein
VASAVGGVRLQRTRPAAIPNQQTGRRRDRQPRMEQITAIIGDDQRYDRGLQRLLDGFEQDLSSGAERGESREA